MRWVVNTNSGTEFENIDKALDPRQIMCLVKEGRCNQRRN